MSTNNYTEIFNNDNLLIVSKKQGIPTEHDSKDSTSLIEEVQKEYGDNCVLCHRLDRNTGGLVIIAKDSETESLITEAIKERKIRKFYRAYVFGKLDGGLKSKQYVQIDAWHFKDAKKSMVFVYDEFRKYSKKISTRYKCIEYDPETNRSLLEIELLTGRTHQIRAQFAHIGHPVLGDGKYGDYKANKAAGFRYQALWSYKIDFCGLLKGYGIQDLFVSKPDFK